MEVASFVRNTNSSQVVGIAAAMLIGTSAFMMTGIQPVVLGSLISAGRLDGASLGVVATAEVLTLSLGSMAGPIIFQGGGMRSKACLAAVLLTVFDILTCSAATTIPMIVFRALSGLMEGVMLGATLYLIAQTDRPERLSALFLAIAAIPQIVAAYYLPVWLVPRFGANAGLLVLVATAVLAIPAALALPSRGKSASDIAGTGLTDDQGRGLAGVWSLVAIAAIVVENVAIGAAWSYLERIGAQHHFSPNTIGLGISGTLAFQMVGAFGVAWAGWRIDYRLALIVGCVLLAADTLILAWLYTPVLYVAMSCVFGLLWLALAPFQVRLAVELDPSRRLAMIIMPLALIGLSLGPLVASPFVSGENIAPVYSFSAFAAMIAAALFVFAIFAPRPVSTSIHPQ